VEGCGYPEYKTELIAGTVTNTGGKSSWDEPINH
jgi:hypothetical protein